MIVSPIGIKEAIATAFPNTEYRRCIVHQVRNTLKYVSDKDCKPFAADLKTIYHAPTEQKAIEARERVTEKWEEKYPRAMNLGTQRKRELLLSLWITIFSFHCLC